MRIGMLTQWFDPEPGPAALPGMLARGLVERGHDVQVLTGFPNYPSGVVASGYRQQRRFDEVRDGVRVRRVALYANHDSSTVRRMANYGSFAASAALSGMDVLRDVDVLWVNYSPVTIGLPMRLQRRLRGTPVVVHVGDLWPDTLFASGFAPAGRAGQLAHRALDRWTDALYERATAVSYISPGVGPLLESRGVPAHRLAYTPMWADEVTNTHLDRATDGGIAGADSATVTLVYAGTLGGAQDLSTFVRACAAVRDLDLRVLIAGSGTHEASLRELAVEVEATNITFLGRLQPSEMPTLMAASDLQYVGLNDHPLAGVTMPSKVQAVLAAGRPIVGSLQGDAADVVARSGGRAVEPGDVAGLAGAIRAMVQPGRPALRDAQLRARLIYEQEFGMARGIDRIEELLVRTGARG
jgi:colanic acid biosynthesis glycosyl transferase WcaI